MMSEKLWAGQQGKGDVPSGSTWSRLAHSKRSFPVAMSSSAANVSGCRAMYTLTTYLE